MVQNLAKEFSTQGFKTTIVLPLYLYDINMKKNNLNNFSIKEKKNFDVRPTQYNYVKLNKYHNYLHIYIPSDC